MSSETFMLYAETYLSNAEDAQTTLSGLAQCAAGTLRTSPGVATYAFRQSDITTRSAQDIWPGCVALESTELYLDDEGFLSHIDSDEFRAGLRIMYKQVKRLGINIFWIGATPPDGILQSIRKSDPTARPLATIQHHLFDASGVGKDDEAALISISCPLAPDRGAAVVDAIDAIINQLSPITFVAFLHPRRPDELRLFTTMPFGSEDKLSTAVTALAGLNTVKRNGAQMLGDVLLYRKTKVNPSTVTRKFSDIGIDCSVTSARYSGFVFRPTLLG